MLAVIKTGGKQYLVAEGDKIEIEKLKAKEGEEVTFSEVLLLQKNKKVEIGRPTIKGAKALGKVLKTAKKNKVVVFHYKAKKRTKTKKGHRQPFTQVEIKKIVA